MFMETPRLSDAMSATGTSRTSANVSLMSAYQTGADIVRAMLVTPIYAHVIQVP
jgi:hypothetical protein